MTTLVKDFGRVEVTSDGSGHHSPGRVRTFFMQFALTVEPDTIERGDDGSVTFADLHLKGHYVVGEWHEEIDAFDPPYSDKGIVACLAAFLGSKGINGWVDWSELGMQEGGEADFDINYAVIDQVWPELAQGPAPRSPGA